VKSRALGMIDLGSSRAAREGRLSAEVLDAYAQCARVTRQSGSSFASAFWMLPRAKRRAVHAIYAFCRLADDIADDPAVGGDRARLLARWRAELESACRGKSAHPVGIALADAIQRFQLPEREFADLLRGVESDLRDETMETWEDLERYCYRVASTVGLLVVRVLGYRNPRALEYARSLGIAVQLTNVLRDVGEDAAAGRIYLAREDLKRLGVEAGDLRALRMTPEVGRLLEFYAARARSYYERAAHALPDEDRRALRPAEAMGRIYRALLEELQRRDFPCLGKSLRLSRRRRLAIAASTWLGFGGGT
jgi:phytoene synthase